ncbi:hypothetical protein [Streptomyces djakartensis]|uniref:Uncharacterized protein n=1 Tax=Streptomyces djakartensis TaxID=68193 RepID=A0ABQ3AFL4_9ACTN|nr:hypothetical protein [Streptomyces djakartensis]GGY46746.1 hypothetical protein GCM10010384_61520 [Streptomyces djakartensis]
MGMTGERRRRVWRWAVIVWAAAVAVAGGLTLWMQDSTEPGGPYRWEQANPDETPDLPPCPTPEEGLAACAYSEAD